MTYTKDGFTVSVKLTDVIMIEGRDCVDGKVVPTFTPRYVCDLPGIQVMTYLRALHSRLKAVAA
jgi:hypothetical protein